MTPSEIEKVLLTIKRESRHTQLIFGGGIIVLALVLMYIAPVVIRTESVVVPSAAYDITSGDLDGHGMVPGKAVHGSATNTTSLPPTHASSTTPHAY